MLENHKSDSLLVAVTAMQLGVLILPFTTSLSFGQISFLIGTNYQCVAHNFIHNPFFNSHRLNALLSVLNSICIGVPQSFYRIHHIEHHRYNNSPGKDKSSNLLHGKNGFDENIFLYSLLGVLRTDFVGSIELPKKVKAR